jgi:hypothetical protein
VSKKLRTGERKCRKVVQARSSGACEICGHLGVQMHHRRNRSQGGRWVPSNIIHVCVECHAEIGAEPAWAVGSGYTVHGTVTVPSETPVRLWWTYEPALLGDDGSVSLLPPTGAWGETPGLGEGVDDDVWPLGEYPEVVL